MEGKTTCERHSERKESGHNENFKGRGPARIFPRSRKTFQACDDAASEAQREVVQLRRDARNPNSVDTFWETPSSGNRLPRCTIAGRHSGILGSRGEIGEPRSGSFTQEVLSWKTEPRSDSGG